MSNILEHPVAGYKVRPRFKIETNYSVAALKKKLHDGLQHHDATCIGIVNPGYATLYIPRNDQHYWSPQLNLTFEETEKGSVLRGLYGPRPVVWTMFVFFYALIGIAVLFIGVLGLSYLMLDKPATILWLVPLLILIFFSLYLVAHFGQKLGEKQMIILHDFTVQCTELVI
jgi:hypothetical protein